jgi:hypothetical protein
MTVRKLRKKQQGPKCSFCQNKAVYRGSLFTKFSCEDHVNALSAEDKQCELTDYSDAQFEAKY